MDPADPTGRPTLAGPESHGPGTEASLAEIDLQGYQDAVEKWVKAHGVRYFSELTNLGILMEEVGEVARLMVRTFGEQSFKASGERPELADELADVMFVLTCIANQTGIDLSAALTRNLEKKTRRDHRRHWNNPKLQAKSKRQ